MESPAADAGEKALAAKRAEWSQRDHSHHLVEILALRGLMFPQAVE